MLSSDRSSAEDTLIYSCAGGCNVGQLSNAAAVKLYQEGLGALFCLAAVGGHVDDLVQKAQEAGCALVIDGCPVQCARRTLEHAGVEPCCHVVVTELGIEKNRKFELCAEEVERVVQALKSAGADTGEGDKGSGCCSCRSDA